MSLNTTNSRNNAIGNGSVSAYSYTYKIFSQNDLEVKVRLISTGVETTLVLTTDYTVSGVGQAAGGTVTLVDDGQAWLDAQGDLLATYAISIRRVRSIVQSADIKNQGDFYPEVHENVFDKLTMTDQQQQDAIDRSIKLPDTVNPADFNTDMPATIVGAAGVSIITNPSGNGFIVGPTASEISNAQAYAAAALASQTAAELAETNAELAEVNAETAETNAETAETNAAASAAAALASQILAAANFAVDNFIGDGAETEYTLSVTPGSINNTDVYINGVRQETSTYSLVGNVVTFSTPPPNLNTIQIKTGRAAVINVPADNSVSTAAYQDASLTVAKLASGLGLFSTGDVKLTFKAVADASWVMMNDGSIGSAASGATTRANADTANLYTLLWNNISDTYAPVSGGRGASAAADFAANKTLTLAKALGRALGISGSGAGLTARSLGQTYGVETHVLSSGEMPSHTHTQNSHSHTIGITSALRGDAAEGGTTVFGGSTATDATTATNQNTGGGAAHENMQPTMFLNAMIKL